MNSTKTLPSLSIGEEFTHNKETYIVTEIIDLSEYEKFCEGLSSTKKEIFQYNARLKLNSGKVSKRGGAFLRFLNGKFTPLY